MELEHKKLFTSTPADAAKLILFSIKNFQAIGESFRQIWEA